jgi:glycosyltransferase involved in cell wall biosynthesis
VRGLDLDHERDLRVVGSADFAEAVRATLSDSDELADARAREMRREIEQRFDWRAVCAPLLREIEPRDPLGDRVARQRSAISA